MRGWRSPESGKPLLHFLHGIGYCSLTYRPMLERLATDFDLWLCDIQGHGDSEYGSKSYGWNSNAELALEAFTQGKVSYGDVPCLGLGHSFGAILTSLMMARDPTCFGQSALLDPPLFPQAMLWAMAISSVLGIGGFSRTARQVEQRRHLWVDRDSAHAYLQGRGMFKGWNDAALRAYIESSLKDTDAGVALKCSPAQEAELFRSYPRNLWGSLKTIKVPLHVIYGARSAPFIEISAKRLKKINPHVNLHKIQGGHCFMQESPAETATVVRNFLLKAI